MKIRPKVPVCTDCDHVFEYRGRNPGQLGGVVVQFGEAYCTKKKKPRLLKRWHKMLRVPDWCKKRIRPSLVRIYDFASTESWLMHENLCKSLGREIAPTASRYTLSEVRQLDLDAYAFQKQVRTTPVEELLNVHLGGTLYQDLPTEHPSGVEHHQTAPYDIPVHTNRIVKDSPLHQLLKKENLAVNSYHHQAIRKLAPDLEVMAESEDGLVEAVYMPSKTFVWALQWHPINARSRFRDTNMK